MKYSAFLIPFMIGVFPSTNYTTIKVLFVIGEYHIGRL